MRLLQKDLKKTSAKVAKKNHENATNEIALKSSNETKREIVVNRLRRQTQHMTSDKKNFTNFATFEIQLKVKHADDSFVYSYDKRTVHFSILRKKGESYSPFKGRAFPIKPAKETVFRTYGHRTKHHRRIQGQRLQH